MIPYSSVNTVPTEPTTEFSRFKPAASRNPVTALIPVQWARRTPGFLDRLNIENVYKEYPVGHGVAPQNFFDMLAWIQERLTA